MPRMSVEVGYARRWFMGVTVTDNLTAYVRRTTTRGRSRRRATRACRTAAATRSHLHTVTNAAASRGAQNYITFESDFIGDDHQNYWHGVDFTFNARTRWGLTFSGGTSTGRSVQDHCAIDVNFDHTVGTKAPDPAQLP